MAGSKGLFELKLSELARVNGSSPAIRILGELMVKDHEKSNNELEALALKRGVTLPASLDEKQHKHYQRLFEKKGKDFDEAYARCMVRDHKAAICEFKKESKNGTAPAAKKLGRCFTPNTQHSIADVERDL
jgi:putative membrane protein